MSRWVTLADYRGWSIVWNEYDHRLMVRWSTFNTHDFHERPRDRTTAIAIAKEWIDRRR